MTTTTKNTPVLKVLMNKIFSKQEQAPVTPKKVSIVLHNDHHNRPEHVIDALTSTFGAAINMSASQAFTLMMRAHTSGVSTLWTGDRNTAEIYVASLKGFGSDPVNMNAMPLNVEILEAT